MWTKCFYDFTLRGAFCVLGNLYDNCVRKFGMSMLEEPLELKKALVGYGVISIFDLL